MKHTYLTCGKIVSTHGVRGAVKAEPWCDSPAVLAGFDRVYFREGDTYTSRAVRGAFVSGRQVVLTLEGVTDMDAAERLRGCVLYAHRDQIPVAPGAMLQEDMIGLPVLEANTDRPLGTLLRIDPSPAADLLVVGTDAGEVLVPMIPPFLRSVSDDGIVPTPPAGMFPEATV